MNDIIFFSFIMAVLFSMLGYALTHEPASKTGSHSCKECGKRKRAPKRCKECGEEISDDCLF